jgi:hypothetical protein
MKNIPVTVIGRPLAARAFVGCDLMPGMEPIDLRTVKRYENARPAVEGKDYLPGTYVERWLA